MIVKAVKMSVEQPYSYFDSKEFQWKKLFWTGKIRKEQTFLLQHLTFLDSSRSWFHKNMNNKKSRQSYNWQPLIHVNPTINSSKKRNKQWHQFAKQHIRSNFNHESKPKAFSSGATNAAGDRFQKRRAIIGRCPATGGRCPAQLRAPRGPRRSLKRTTRWRKHG